MRCLQADKLLSQEFQPIVEQLIGFLAPERQIMLYSATFPVTVKHFKERFLKKAHIINLMADLTLKGITQVRADHRTKSALYAPVKLLYPSKLSCPEA